MYLLLLVDLSSFDACLALVGLGDDGVHAAGTDITLGLGRGAQDSHGARGRRQGAHRRRLHPMRRVVTLGLLDKQTLIIPSAMITPCF